MKAILLFDNPCSSTAMSLRRRFEERGARVTITDRLHDACQALERSEFGLVIINIVVQRQTPATLVEIAKRKGIRLFILRYKSQSSGAAVSEDERGDRDGLPPDDRPILDH